MEQLGKHIHSIFATMLEKLVAKAPDLLSALILVLVFFGLAFLIRYMLRIMLVRIRINSTVIVLTTRLAYYVVIAFGLIEALGQLHMNLSALGLGVGAFGFAMGFALRDILSNFLSGILILGTRHFSVGDQIRIKEYEGTVEAIEMRGTILKTYDGRRVTIPNSEVYTNAVINNTIYTMRRSSIFVGVSYDSDLEMVKELILTALKTVPNVAQQPQPDVLVKELGNYSIQLEIRIWTSAQQIDVLTVNSTATKAIKEALRAGGVQIPFPTQIIIIHDSE